MGLAGTFLQWLILPRGQIPEDCTGELLLPLTCGIPQG